MPPTTTTPIAIQDLGRQNSRRQGLCGHFDSSPLRGPREGRPCFFSELGTPRQQELHRHFTFPQGGRGYVAAHLMLGRLLMEATEPPCEMTEGMRLSFAHCAASSTPPHFVANGMKIVARSVRPTHSWGPAYSAQHMSHLLCKRISNNWSHVVCFVAKEGTTGATVGILGTNVGKHSLGVSPTNEQRWHIAPPAIKAMSAMLHRFTVLGNGACCVPGHVHGPQCLQYNAYYLLLPQFLLLCVPHQYLYPPNITVVFCGPEWRIGCL